MFRRLKKLLPNKDSFHNHPILSALGDYLFDESLWRFNRQTASRGFFVGVLISFVPLPIQTPLAAITAHALGANMPLSLLLVWLSNPLTWIPMFTPCYLVGCALFGIENISLSSVANYRDFYHALSGEHFIALLLGSAVIGITLATISFMMINILWRYSVRNRWAQRRFHRQNTDKEE